MNQKISTILFDADGVLQYPAVDYRLVFDKIFAARAQDAERLLSDIFLIERASLDGKRDFKADLTELLARWGFLQNVEQILNISTQIASSDAVFSTIRSLRSQGFLCCLASNQQPYRARYMSNTLGYSGQFDKEFYSCDLGFIKPDRKYFDAILSRLDQQADTVLFIDDQEANVVAARSAGLNGAVFSGTIETSDRILKGILADHGVLVQKV
jgi:putative hydrolase of the HAD superfamily